MPDLAKTLEPKGCPFYPKGADGLCSHHAEIFRQAAVQETTIAYKRVAYLIEAIANPRCKNKKRTSNGNSASQQPNK